MKVNGQNAWIIASLNVVISNLSQENNMVRVLKHNANRGCRIYITFKNSLTDNT